MTNPSHYYARVDHDGRIARGKPVMTYKPTLIEREGEFIAAVLGASVIGFALGMLVIAMVFLP